MRPSPQSRIYLLQILPFGVIWMIASVIYMLLEKGLLDHLDYYPATGIPYDFNTNFPIIVVGSTIWGLLIGSIEVFILSKLFTRASFRRKFSAKTSIYIVFVVGALLSLSIVGNMISRDLGFFDPILWATISIFFKSIAFWSIEFYMAATIVLSSFFYEVSGNLGHNVLANFFTGRYHSPVEEDRIFLFLDMRSSTSIAEKLGHIKYFELLREYYAVLTPAIVRNGGEIYQYVGDEIVVTWRLENCGVNSPHILCFFEMKQTLKDHHYVFMHQFGVAPTFKGGLHCGSVTAGEIGVVKQDIIFTGDVLNATARIQSLCNQFEVDNLVSLELKSKFPKHRSFEFKTMGRHQLRGRKGGIELFTVSEERPLEQTDPLSRK